MEAFPVAMPAVLPPAVAAAVPATRQAAAPIQAGFDFSPPPADESRLPAPAETPAPGPALEDCHPALWRAHQVGRTHEASFASGHAALDAVLPGGGWPARVLTELLLPHPGIGEMRLLAPALAALQPRGVMLFDPPALPFGWALGACGLDLRQLYVVRGRGRNAHGRLPAADTLWAIEQALKSGQVGVVLAWLPARLAADSLRRLQLAAQAHDGPVFLLRDEVLRSKPSPAPLRLLLGSTGADTLRVQLLKRRGPPLAQPLALPLPPVLPASARRRAEAGTRLSSPHPETSS